MPPLLLDPLHVPQNFIHLDIDDPEEAQKPDVISEDDKLRDDCAMLLNQAEWDQRIYESKKKGVAAMNAQQGEALQASVAVDQHYSSRTWRCNLSRVLCHCPSLSDAALLRRTRCCVSAAIAAHATSQPETEQQLPLTPQTVRGGSR